MLEITVRALYLFMGRDLYPLTEARAGNIFGISGIENAIYKTATIVGNCPDIASWPNLSSTNYMVTSKWYQKYSDGSMLTFQYSTSNLRLCALHWNRLTLPTCRSFSRDFGSSISLILVCRSLRKILASILLLRLENFTWRYVYNCLPR